MTGYRFAAPAVPVPATAYNDLIGGTYDVASTSSAGVVIPAAATVVLCRIPGLGVINDQDMFDLVDRALAGGRTREVILALVTLGSSLLSDWADAKGISLLEAAAQSMRWLKLRPQGRTRADAIHPRSRFRENPGSQRRSRAFG